CSGEKYFFFQAEDGIRYLIVTGVQTCALPICRRERRSKSSSGFFVGSPGPWSRTANVACESRAVTDTSIGVPAGVCTSALRTRRSEERRVGKEGRVGGVLGGGERMDMHRA